MDSANPQAPATPLSLGLVRKLYRYRNLVRNHWWILLLTIGLGLACGGYVLFRNPHLFGSVSQLVVREELVRDSETGTFKYDFSSLFGTAIEQLKSPLVLEGARSAVAMSNPNLAGTVEITSSVTPRANILTVTGIGSDPLYTQKFVDAVVAEFLKWRAANRTGQASQVSGSLIEQETQTRKELDQNKAKLQKFTEENNMQFWTEQRNKAVAYLLELNTKKTQLNDELQRLQNLTPDELLHSAGAAPPAFKSQAEATGSGVSAKQEATFNSGLYNEYIKASQEFFQRQADYTEWKAVWKPAHPKLKAIVADLERLKRQIDIIKEQNANMVKARGAAIRAELKSIDVSLPEWDAKVLEASRKDAEYQTLQGNVTRVQSQLDKLIDEMKRIKIGSDTTLDPLRVMHTATSPKLVQRTLKHLLLGFLGGLAVGCLVLGFLDRADDRLSSSTEMIEHFSEPILGQIPNVIKSRNETGLPLLREEEERFSYAEAFRSLRSSLIFMPNKSELKSLLITSAIPNEGKSTIASNLAITMAAAGARVLLVDADLRRGDLAQLFDLNGEIGLSNILRGESPWKSAVMETAYPTLSLIPRGPVTNQSGELLLRPILPGLLSELKAAYDLVIFNTAPILATDDTPTLAPNFDGTLMVIRAQFTSARLTKNALNVLYERQVNVLGLILNAINVEAPDYYYYRYNQYYAA